MRGENKMSEFVCYNKHEYYRSSITGVIITDSELDSLEKIIGSKRVNQFFKDGTFFKLRNLPSVERILNSGGSLACAINRYREIYPDITLRDAMAAVKSVRVKVEKARSNYVE